MYTSAGDTRLLKVIKQCVCAKSIHVKTKDYVVRVLCKLFLLRKIFKFIVLRPLSNVISICQTLRRYLRLFTRKTGQIETCNRNIVIRQRQNFLKTQELLGYYCASTHESLAHFGPAFLYLRQVSPSSLLWKRLSQEACSLEPAMLVPTEIMGFFYWDYPSNRLIALRTVFEGHFSRHLTPARALN